MTITKGTVIVTRANGGLVSALVEQIASKAELSVYHGFYTVRDTEHAPALVSALAHGTKHPHEALLSICLYPLIRQSPLAYKPGLIRKEQSCEENRNSSTRHPPSPFDPKMRPREPSVTCGTRSSSPRPARSAGEVLEAAFGVVGKGGNPPRDMYFDGGCAGGDGEESRDDVKRRLVWREKAKLAGLKGGETVLTN